jgi:hypothetical protein
MGRDHLVGASPTRAMVGWPGSWQAVRLGNWPYRSPATNLALGGGANRRAVTCVKPEQASKGKLWTPTRPEFGEGSMIWGSSRQMHLERSTGVGGTARRDRGSRKRGRPVLDEGSGLNGVEGHGSKRESDRVIVPSKPGNAGRGKDPDFWYVCRRRRGLVTWRKPIKHRLKPDAIRANSVATPRRRRGMEHAHATARRMPAMKPVGKPDAGNPHVRFDERGGETGRANGTAPFLDSTFLGDLCVTGGRRIATSGGGCPRDHAKSCSSAPRASALESLVPSRVSRPTNGTGGQSACCDRPGYQPRSVGYQSGLP